MKKFGLTAEQEEKALLEKRKQKFVNAPTEMKDEDDETIRLRREKFGQVAVQEEDKGKLEERKRKFGNPEGDIALDDLIKKSKGIRKDQQHHKPHPSRSGQHQQPRYHNNKRGGFRR
jgi:hypothetical protein